MSSHHLAACLLARRDHLEETIGLAAALNMLACEIIKRNINNAHLILRKSAEKYGCNIVYNMSSSANRK